MIVGLRRPWQESLNQLMSLPHEQRRDLRHAISGLLYSQTTADRQVIEKAMFFQTDVNFVLPCKIGRLFGFLCVRLPCYQRGQHVSARQSAVAQLQTYPDRLSRACFQHRCQRNTDSSTAGSTVTGQGDDKNPTRAACKLLDYELEVGCFIAQGNELAVRFQLSKSKIICSGCAC